MNKFNRIFNSRIKRLNIWLELKARLSQFESLLTSFDGLSPREVLSLKLIHRKIYEAYTIAKKHESEVKHDLQTHSQSVEQFHR